MRLKKIHRKSRTFRMFVANYIIISIIPIMVLTAVFTNLTYSIRKDIDTNQHLISEQFKSGIDSHLYNLIQFGDKLAGDAVIMQFTSQDSILDHISNTENFEILRAVSNTLSGISSINSAIRQSYIYAPKSEKVFSTKGVRTSWWYYKASFTGSESSYMDWKNTVSSVEGTRLLSFQANMQNTIPSEISYAVQLYYNEKNPITLVLELNPNDISAQILALQAQGVQLAIFQKGKFPVFASSSLFSEIPADTLFSGDENYTSRKISTSQGDMMINRLYSAQTECTYFVATPYKVYYKQISSVQKSSIAILLLLMLGNAYLVSILAKRSYQPVDRILKNLLKNHPADCEDIDNGIDDFQYIQEVIGKLSNKNTSMETKLYRQSNTMGDYVIGRLLYGKYASPSAMQSSLELADIHFTGDIFLVVLIWSDEYLNSDGEEIERLQFVACNVFNELFSAHFPSRATPMDGKTGILLNLENEPDQTTRDMLLSCAQQGREFIKKNFNSAFYITLSNFHHTIQGVQKAYCEAEALMEQASELSPISCMWLGRTEKKCSAFSAFSADFENKLHNLLLVGNSQGAKELISDEITGSKFSNWKKEILLADTCVALLRFISGAELSEQQVKSLDEKIAPVLQDKRYTLNSVCTIIDIIDEYVCQKEQEQRAVSVEKKVQDYVKEHFSDSELTVGEIAEHVGLHVNYLSSLYKKKTGESILDCINSYRLTYAKNLLRKGTLHIEEIGQRCGYYNSAGFIRSFKKYEGITPGQYRSMQHFNV